MNLPLLWFALIGMLFMGFFILEGFDFGVGMLLPFVSKGDTERGMAYASIGPFWDGNEVWLISAGGALFAAFPAWYATLFSGFYLETFLLLVALVVRAAAIEFRGKREQVRWRRFWDCAMCVGSALPGFLWGVIVANIMEGLPIDAAMNIRAPWWSMFRPYALLGGVLFVVLFALHGAIFLNLRVTGPLRERARVVARRLWLPALALLLLFVAGGYVTSEAMRRVIETVWIVPLVYLALALLTSVGFLVARGYSGWAFAMTGSTIALLTVIIGLGLFPQVMPSSLNPAWSLTIYNAASGSYTLTIISWLALTLIPFVLLYQGWSYWIFRKRLEPHMVSGH